MRCPYCGSAMDRDINSYPLSIKQAKVFKAVLENGQAGISVQDLLRTIFKGRSDITIRTSIHNLNKKIAPMRLVLNGKVVRLHRT